MSVYITSRAKNCRYYAHSALLLLVKLQLLNCC